ncbi:hypothetical protein XENORESO_021901 [Xenotaenia resolanae]|uniref:EMI domain-containing protein n=1 Tax=Xenotaenia resolanae TaxID=208358 RepID=A0ABV0WWU2_9TELE
MGSQQLDALFRKSLFWTVLILWLSTFVNGTWKTGLYKGYSAVSQKAATHTSIYQKRNWCPHTVTKTVTCQVQNGTILQRVYQTCRWPQGCSGGSYKTVVRPSYKVVYRTVTSLEWKCCPGFSGTACEEVLECLSAQPEQEFAETDETAPRSEFMPCCQYGTRHVQTRGSTKDYITQLHIAKSNPIRVQTE